MKLEHHLKRATRGLPPSERIHAMAELRTHLLERIEQLQLQGFSVLEAEQIALEQFGDVQGLSRKLSFAHWTLPAGWATFGVLLALLAGTLQNRAWAHGTEGQPAQHHQQGNLRILPLGKATQALRFDFASPDGRTWTQQVPAKGEVRLQVLDRQQVSREQCAGGVGHSMDFQWDGGHLLWTGCGPSQARYQQSKDSLLVVQPEFKVRVEAE